MNNCLVCERIELTKNGENPYFVRELSTGYVVIGDCQRIRGYSLFLCREHATELHFLEPEFRAKFLWEMSLVAEAVYRAFGAGVHMHWHFFPRRAGDVPKPGPVWQLGSELHAKEYYPTEEELEDLKRRLNAQLDLLL